MDAIKVVASVAANLIAILGLIAFLNALLSYFGARVGFPQLTFQVNIFLVKVTIVRQPTPFWLLPEPIFAPKTNNTRIANCPHHGVHITMESKSLFCLQSVHVWSIIFMVLFLDPHGIESIMMC